MILQSRVLVDWHTNQNKNGFKGEIMSFKSIIFITYLLFPVIAWASPATQTPTRMIGFDFAIPYLFTVDGNGFHDPDHMNAGMHVNYFISNNVAFGTRFSVDIEEDTGRFRRWVLAPGIMYQWFQGRTWMPYIRTDIPVVIKGAITNSGSNSKQDVGFLGGFGLAWNIGNQMGLKNLLLSYEFSARYFFGFGDALRNFGVEFARFGIQYRF